MTTLRETPAWMRPAALLPVLLIAVGACVASEWVGDIVRVETDPARVASVLPGDVELPDDAAWRIAGGIGAPADEEQPHQSEDRAPRLPDRGEESGAGGVSDPALIVARTAVGPDGAGASPPVVSSARLASLVVLPPQRPPPRVSLRAPPSRLSGRMRAAATPPRGPPVEA